MVYPLGGGPLRNATKSVTMPMMSRTKLSRDELIDIVAERTYELLRRLRPESGGWEPIVRRRFQRGAVPNWDMDCGLFALSELHAFEQARDEAKALYDLDVSTE